MFYVNIQLTILSNKYYIFQVKKITLVEDPKKKF